MSDADTNENGVKAAARRQHGLGRGLSALFAETKRDVAVDGEQDGSTSGGPGRSVQLVDVAAIAPHPDQPRRHFDEDALQELADSIATRGVIQPIIVRQVSAGQYQIVAGERRWRASQRAQLHRIPVIVRDFNEAETLEIALVENIQREDLNPIEEAQAYKRLIGQFGHSQDALGRIVGKSRSHVANIMRLLELPSPVQDMVMHGTLSMGHARALIGADNSVQLAEMIVDKGLSVREIEDIVRKRKSESSGGETKRGKTTTTTGAVDADIAALERDLGDILGMRVAIAHGSDGRGTVTVSYSTLDQLDMLCQRLHGGAI